MLPIASLNGVGYTEVQRSYRLPFYPLSRIFVLTTPLTHAFFGSPSLCIADLHDRFMHLVHAPFLGRIIGSNASYDENPTPFQHYSPRLETSWSFSAGVPTDVVNGFTDF